MDSFLIETLTMSDGVALRVFDRPGPDPDSPTLLLSNGLGGNLQTWRHLVAARGAEYRILSWDYRGLYGSGLTPEQRGSVALDVSAHARDAEAVLAWAGAEHVVLVGWSMGVQLNFELVRRSPKRALAIVAMSGGYGQTLSRTIAGPWGERAIRPGLDVFRALMDALGPRLGRRGRWLIHGAKTLRLVHPNVDVEVFNDLLTDYMNLDFEVYTQILGALGDHDAEAVLSTLECPVLIVSGDRDPMTPDALSSHMAATIPDAELMIVPGGTHYVPVEFPVEINERILGFLGDKLRAAA
jgi:pimeloyl-ACP methyl ester carboxylesterase